ESAAAGAYTLSVACGQQLDCSAATQIACTQVISGDTSRTVNRVSIYNCSTEALVGGEDIYRFYNPIEQTVEARFLSADPGQRILLLPSCDEATCFLSGAGGVSCALFPPGEYILVVDGTTSGRYSFQLSCSEVRRGVDLRVPAIDTRTAGGSLSDFGVSGTTEVGVANLG